MDFRDYQIEAVETTEQLLQEHQSVLNTLPTGSGKTVAFSKLIENYLAEGKTVGVVVHRKNLVDALSRRLQIIPGAKIAVEQADRAELSQNDFNVAVCSVQTLQSRPEVAKGLALDLIVVDEVHRAMAEGYLETLQLLGYPKAKMVGWTATNFRGDGQSLTDLFESEGITKDIVWGLKEGWLIPIYPKRYGIKRMVVREDGSTGMEKHVYQGKELIDKVVETFEESCTEDGEIIRPSLFMAPSVDAGRDLEAALRAAGWEARMVDSKMDQQKRYEYERAFEDNDGLKCLIGYNVFIEGFDAPHASALFWMRNTQSAVTFVQGLGRVTRPYFEDSQAFQAYNQCQNADKRREMLKESAKPDALFFDFADASSSFNLAALLGLSNNFDFEEASLLDAIELMDEVTDSMPMISPSAIESYTDIGNITEDAELWQQAVQPNHGAPPNAQLVYHRARDSWSTIFPNSRSRDDDVRWTMRIRQNARGAWIAEIGQPEIYKEWYYNGSTYKQKFYKGHGKPDMSRTTRVFGKEQPRYIKICGMPFEQIATAETKDEIFYLAERYVYDKFPRSVWDLSHKNAKWRFKPLSSGQNKILRKMRKKGIPIPEEVDRTVASVLISRFFAGYLTPDTFKRVSQSLN